MAIGIWALDVVVGELVARPLRAKKGASDKLEGPFRRERGGPDRNGEPVSDLVTKQCKEWGVGARGEERLSKGDGGGGRAQL